MSGVKVAQLCLTLCDPMDYTVHGIIQANILECVAIPFSRNLPNPGIEPRSSTLQEDSLPVRPPGKPKNTGVSSLSLLQGLFPTQGSNPGLPHCKRILYSLSHLEWTKYSVNLSFTICLSGKTLKNMGIHRQAHYSRATIP